MHSLTFKFNMESFFYSTHLPIKAFSLKGIEFYSVGYDKIANSILEKVNLEELISKINYAINPTSSIDILLLDEISFTICPINYETYEFGFYLIGPYTINEDSKKAIFKPKHCIKYLLNILYMNSESESTNSIEKTSYNLNVNKAIKYIEENYKSNCTLDKLCENININKSYFCTLFKEHTGKTFSKYLSHYRIDKAKELLKYTELSITEIAFTVGYNSVNYFNNHFKQLNNITPVQYRNNINS